MNSRVPNRRCLWSDAARRAATPCCAVNFSEPAQNNGAPELLTEADRLHARGGCAGNVPLLMKDVVLFVTLVYFLKQDVERVRVSSEKASVERPLRQIRHIGNHADAAGVVLVCRVVEASGHRRPSENGEKLNGYRDDVGPKWKEQDTRPLS